MCGKGSTFRDKFNLRFERSQNGSPSMNHLCSACFEGIILENHAFSLLLKSLPFVQDSNLESLLSCRDFEK